MDNEVFKNDEIEQILAHGLTEQKVLAQVNNFKKGFPYSNLNSPATIDNGLVVIKETDFDNLINEHNKAQKEGRITKFVPASGAASRMFKTLLYFNNEFNSIKIEEIREKASTDKEAKEMLKFMEGLSKFAFYNDLAEVLKKDNLVIENLIAQGEYKQILEYLLTEKGLNYSNLPKSLLKFHSYSDSNRTSFEEHLVEGIEYAKSLSKKVSIHFTVSQEHLALIQNLFNSVKTHYETFDFIDFDITYSIQKASTDTIAVDLENKLFKDKKGKLVFRPAGHGALIENLNDLKGDIIFIKNIDNVVPDSIKETTYLYKKLLSGYLLKLQNKAFEYLEKIENKLIDESSIEALLNFINKDLCVDTHSFDSLESKVNFAFKILNRPIRVCGMVKNQGEPGGGPFWVLDKNNSKSLQIVETSQIDVKNPDQKTILDSSTHFNPVDLVCGVKNYKGENFNLTDFVDPDTGFISLKSKDGKDLKAMELPGLWNGAMAYWNTIFIEVPLITFNPVKTVNDLLRKEHQR